MKLISVNKIDISYFYSRKSKNFLELFIKQIAALSSVTQDTISRKLGGTWGMGCLNTRFSLITLLW